MNKKWQCYRVHNKHLLIVYTSVLKILAHGMYIRTSTSIRHKCYGCYSFTQQLCIQDTVNTAEGHSFVSSSIRSKAACRLLGVKRA